jgi:hypothetical protein
MITAINGLIASKIEDLISGYTDVYQEIVNHWNPRKSKCVLPAYKVYISDQLANKFKPIAYSHECLSGDPEALYYRKVKRVDGEELCIQYYFYWLYQKSIVALIYDYDPILLYLRNDSFIYLIVNGPVGTHDAIGSKNGF